MNLFIGNNLHGKSMRYVLTELSTFTLTCVLHSIDFLSLMNTKHVKTTFEFLFFCQHRKK